MIEKSMYLKRIGKNIATCREKKGYSQEELSRKCGYTSENSRSTIQKIESGKSDIPASKLCALAQALGVSVLELLKCSDDINIGGDNTNSAVGLGNTVTNLNDNSTTYNIQNLSEQEQELLRIYRDITPKGQIALMNTAYDIEKQYQKKGNKFQYQQKSSYIYIVWYASFRHNSTLFTFRRMFL